MKIYDFSVLPRNVLRTQNKARSLESAWRSGHDKDNHLSSDRVSQNFKMPYVCSVYLVYKVHSCNKNSVKLCNSNKEKDEDSSVVGDSTHHSQLGTSHKHW